MCPNFDLKKMLSIIAKINCENLLNLILNVKKEIESLKIDLNDIKSEHKVSRSGLDSLKSTFDKSEREALLSSEKLMSLIDDV